MSGSGNKYTTGTMAPGVGLDGLIRIGKRGRATDAVPCTTSIGAANMLTWEPVCSDGTFSRAESQGGGEAVAAAALMLISE
jgi:hypothetical protein